MSRVVKGINESPTTNDTVKLYFETFDSSGDYVTNYVIQSVHLYFLDFSPLTEQVELLETAQGEIVATVEGGILGYEPLWDGSVSARTDFVRDGDGFTLYWTPQDTGAEREGFYAYVWSYINPDEYVDPQASDWQERNVWTNESQTFYLYNVPEMVYSSTRKFNRESYKQLIKRMQPSFYYESGGEENVSFHEKFMDALSELIFDSQELVDSMSELLDPDFAPAPALMYLANQLNVKLFSRQSDRWRIQIKKAVSSYKKKGSLAGLRDAISSVGGSLTAFTSYYQVIADRTWTDEITLVTAEHKSDDGITWEFEVPYDVDTDSATINKYFAVRRWNNTSEEVDWIINPNAETPVDPYDYVQFVGARTIKWLNTAPVSLVDGETIVIDFPVEITGPTPAGWADIQDYILSLPLLDQRNWGVDDNFYPGDMPPKNWNTRLIATDDPYFNSVCEQTNAFQDPVVFGYERTIIPYSEQVYNMDEYDGSARSSYNPKFISPDFVDTCSCGKSSAFSVTIKQDKLGDIIVEDVKEIVKRFTPFHSTLHSISWVTSLTDFLLPFEEGLSVLARIVESEPLIVGKVDFSRAIGVGDVGAGSENYLRNSFGSLTTVLTGSSGQQNNLLDIVYAPSSCLNNLPINSSTKITIDNVYDVVNIVGNSSLKISSYTGSLRVGFPYKLFGLQNWLGSTEISNSTVWSLMSASVNFVELGVQENYKVELEQIITGASGTVVVTGNKNGVLSLTSATMVSDGFDNGTVIIRKLLTPTDVVLVENKNGSIIKKNKATATLPVGWDAESYDIKLRDYAYTRLAVAGVYKMLPIESIDDNVVTLLTDEVVAAAFTENSLRFYREIAHGTYCFVDQKSFTLADDSVNFVTSGVQAGDYVNIGAGYWLVETVAEHSLELVGVPLPLDCSNYSVEKMVPADEAYTRSQAPTGELFVMVLPTFPFVVPLNGVTETSVVGDWPEYNIAKEIRDRTISVTDTLAAGGKDVLSQETPSGPLKQDEVGAAEYLTITVKNLDDNSTHDVIVT